MIYKLELILVVLGVFMFFSKPSQAVEFKQGLVKGKLQGCPNSPNCVNTEIDMLEPFKIGQSKQSHAWSILQQIIAAHGGQLQLVQDNYLWAVFKTPILGFTDDVEARLDVSQKVIHLRSASRVGYYDFGTNRRRLQKIFKAMHIALKQKSMDNRDE